MKSKILKILREADTYVSGQIICNQLGVSRTAIWKAINQLKVDGYQIESITNKGYRIITYPDAITKESLESQMKTKTIGRKVYYQEEVDSTNNIAKRLVDSTSTAKHLSNYSENHGLLVIAEHQHAGKGRRGRTWVSPKGTGIWMTLALTPQISPTHASMLTLVTALSVAEAIRQETTLEAMIKWPNDIVVNNRKVCGILTEMSSEPDYIHYVVIGIGINANTETFPEEISPIAASLKLELSKEKCKDQLSDDSRLNKENNQTINRSHLICKIMENFEHHYETFLQTESLINLQERYNTLLINAGKQVKVIEPGNQPPLTGTALGINPQGELLINTGTQTQAIMSGEVSVRGLYGYV